MNNRQLYSTDIYILLPALHKSDNIYVCFKTIYDVNIQEYLF